MAVASLLWRLAAIFTFLSVQIDAQNADCDFYQNVQSGVNYYVYSPGYPANYPKSKTCRWQALCPVNTRCRLVCATINIPYSTSCVNDRLLISKTGDPTLTGADKYCGQGSLDILSTSNALAIGLVTTATTTGGYFSCTLTAQPVSGTGQCACGWKKTMRIVGGVQTGINEYPMMVGLVDGQLRIIYCGGTIISDRWVLTAAHCLDNQQTSNVKLLIGDHNIRIGTETSSSKLLGSIQMIKHPSYTTNSYNNDIGLLKSDAVITFSDRVGPACLPFNYATTTFENAYVDILGWGTTSFAGSDSDYLQKVTIPVISRTSCANSLGSIGGSTNVICTYASGKDSCQHDSGGPALWQNPSNGRLYLIGIIIGGYGCATSKPGINTRVTEYLQWISTAAVGANLCRA